MGCHTWFYRPLTEEEFKDMKKHAPDEIMELLAGDNDKILRYLLMKSYKENKPCAYGKFWWQLGWGAGRLYPTQLKGERRLFVQVCKYHDIFRVKNYPRKVIHNRRELRRFLRKEYFTLTQTQLERISEFFQKYKGGVIHFG